MDGDDCISQSLIKNGWASMEEVQAMKEYPKKNLLYQKLNHFYNGDIHTSFDLSQRQIHGDRESLCGMASVYQAATDTILTAFQIKSMSYTDLRGEILKVVEKDPLVDRLIPDKDLLKQFHSCKCSNLFSMYKRYIFNI